jgi:CheY-like chemotaxis protein
MVVDAGSVDRKDSYVGCATDWYSATVILKRARVLHVCSRETIIELRDQILRLQGYEVLSSLHFDEALNLFRQGQFELVLVDVEGESRVTAAEQFCSRIKEDVPDQKVAYVCNHRVAITSDCPDELIHAEFNPEALVRGVREMVS